jgi:hypothetical protein
MSRNARRIAVSLSTAAGAAVIAASFSIGNAPVAGADVLGANVVSDLLAASAAEALPAAGVSNTMALSYLIEAFDPLAFTAAGAPQDPLGLIGFYADTYFLGPTGLDAELAPLVQELVGTISSGTPGTYEPAISDLVAALDPQAFTGGVSGVAPTDEFGELAYLTDTYLFGPFGIDNLIAPFVQEIIAGLPAGAESVDVSPVADLLGALDFGALDPGAFGAGAADLSAPIIDGLLNSGLSLF